MSSSRLPNIMNSEQVQETDTPIASVVIPAHNEAAVLGRLLDALPVTIGNRPLQVIVACNGCTDGTAEVARARGATVVEVETPSKIAALNAGDDAAVAFPRLYIDADVVLSGKTVTDLIQALSEPGALCVAPPSQMELTGRPWTVKAYFSVWRAVMQMKEGYVGSGVYAFSKLGRARFGLFPNVIADDLFVRNLYTRSERRVISTEATIVEAPRTLRALFRRRIRVRIGNAELASHPSYGSLPGSDESKAPWWRAVLSEPALFPAAFVFAAVNGMAHFAARRQIRSRRPVDWARDDTTRTAPAAPINEHGSAH